MGKKTPAQKRAAKQRLREKMRTLIREQLGTECVVCGSTDQIEYDHMDPATRLFKLSRAHDFSLARVWAEMDKCEALCKSCHILKTVRGQEYSPLPPHVRAMRLHRDYRKRAVDGAAVLARVRKF